jgi:hypothetical protein
MRENRRHMMRMMAVCGMATIGATGILMAVDPVVLGGSTAVTPARPGGSVAVAHRPPLTNLVLPGPAAATWGPGRR